MRPVLLVLLPLAAPPALAGGLAPPVGDLRADLDGNGQPETFALREGEDGAVDLVVMTEGRTRVAPGIAWSGGLAGQEPDLAVSLGNSLLLSSRNEAAGRDRWTQTLDIVPRDGEWWVAGLTYEWRDTLDPAAGGTCDFDLLAGSGTVTTAEGEREIAAPMPATPVWDWRAEDMVLPEQCY